jgi:hypothetical protein
MKIKVTMESRDTKSREFEKTLENKPMVYAQDGLTFVRDAKEGEEPKVAKLILVVPTHMLHGIEVLDEAA